MWCKLGDLAHVGTGATPMTKYKDYYYKGEIAWINSSSTNASYIENASNFITQKAISETNCVIYPKGTLILAMYGEGKTRGQISELLIEAATNQACAAICPFSKETKEYVKIFFESNYLHIRTLAEGGTQPNLNIGKISSYNIPFPPIEEQNRIVEETKHWIALINIIEQKKSDLQETIKQAKSKILDLAIHGKLVPQDPTDEPASELLKRINPKAEITCDNPHYRNLPKGWAICSLEQVANILDNLRKPINSNERNARINNKHESELFPYYGATGQVGFIDDYLIDGSYLLLGEDGAPFLDKNATKAYSIEGKCWVNNHAHILKPLCNFNYLMYYLNQVDYKDYVNGSTRLKLTQSDMRSIKILLPPMAEQERISTKVKELFYLLDNIFCFL